MNLPPEPTAAARAFATRAANDRYFGEELSFSFGPGIGTAHLETPDQCDAAAAALAFELKIERSMESAIAL